MAPRGSRGRAPAGRSGPTKAATSTSTSTRGGRIQKKSRGPTKVDVDGDQDMDTASRAASKSKGPSSRTSTRLNPRDKSRITQSVARHVSGGPNTVFLRVRGLRDSKAHGNSDGGKESLVIFLEKKASTRAERQIVIKKIINAGRDVLVSASERDAEELKKINGFSFAGATLEISEDLDSAATRSNKATTSEHTEDVRAQLRRALDARHDKDLKLLKLNVLAADPVLTQLGAFQTIERARKTFKSLMVLCDHQFKTQRERDESIISITLAENNIQSVDEVASLADTFPRLRNLDLRGNQLASLSSGLGSWKGKLKSLENIYLQGNPLETTEPDYKATLVEWFPKLQCVDDAIVQTPEQITQREAAMAPKAIPQSGPLFRDVDGIGQTFLLDFFPLFDSDRYLLATRYYDEGSHFSLAVDTQAARDPNAPPPLPWASYIKTSRNLARIKTTNARIQRLFTGPGTIYESWKGMPQTRHPSIKDDIVKYIADCHPMSGIADPTQQNPLGGDGLMICIHGEFEEYDPKEDKVGRRSFSRTFILGPGNPEKCPVRVVSDMLSLRAYSPLPNVYGGAQNPPSTQPPAPPVDVERQKAMVAELSNRTGLTAEYSEMCLSQVDWDFQKALERYEEKKSNLPPDAWSTPPQ